MPHHIHTAPQCGYWTGHDPSCFDQALGAEVDCVLIELGVNKGKYMCIHKRPPEGGQIREAAVKVLVDKEQTEEFLQDYVEIRAVLRPASAYELAAPPIPKSPNGGDGN